MSFMTNTEIAWSDVEKLSSMFSVCGKVGSSADEDNRESSGPTSSLAQCFSGIRVDGELGSGSEVWSFGEEVRMACGNRNVRSPL